MKLLRFATDYLNDVLGLSRIQIRSDGYEFELSENVDYDGDWDIERIDVDKIKILAEERRISRLKEIFTLNFDSRKKEVENQKKATISRNQFMVLQSLRHLLRSVKK